MKKAITLFSIITPIISILSFVALLLVTPLSTVNKGEGYPVISDEFIIFRDTVAQWFSKDHLPQSAIMISVLAIILIAAIVWFVCSIVRKRAYLIWSLASTLVSFLFILFVATVFFSQKDIDSIFNNTVLNDTMYPAARLCALVSVCLLLLAQFLALLVTVLNMIQIFRKHKEYQVVISDDPLVLVQRKECLETADAPIEPVEKAPETPVENRDIPRVLNVEETKAEEEPVVREKVVYAEQAPVAQFFSEDQPKGCCCNDSLSTCKCKDESDDIRSPRTEALLEIMHNELLPSSLSSTCVCTVIPHQTSSAPIIVDEERNPSAESLSADDVRRIIREELEKVVGEKTVKVAVAPVEPVKVDSEEDSDSAGNAGDKPKIIRIPFTDRIAGVDKEMKDHFNELKSEIMSYGMHSRVSNSGDTFRLHTKTYVKITIAGKSLKLYYALDPKDYANTTLPIIDAGHKGIYKEIPFVFKVKSELSMRRAKQLIADVMEKNGIDQQPVVAHDWVKDIENNNYSK